MNGSLCLQNLAVAGQVQQVHVVLTTETFPYKIIHAGKFSPKDQVVLDHKDCKQ